MCIKKLLIQLFIAGGCISPSYAYAQLHFMDVSNDAGVNHQFIPYQGTFGGGAAILDLNNDGLEDIFITGGMTEDALYVNNGNGTFKDIYAQSGLRTKKKYVTQGAVCADVNKDGWVDIFITTIKNVDTSTAVPRAENLLFLNNGNRTFRNATKEYDLDKYLTFSTGATFGDINNDGYPDLFVANYFEAFKGELNIMNDAMIVNSGQMGRDFLFINKKGKYFEEESEKYNLNVKGFGFGGVLTDFDGDHDLDLFIINDFGYKAPSNFLFENQFPDKTFKDVSKGLNMKLRINGMGVAIGDYNNDGWLDYFFTNIRTNQFMVNQGKGKPFLNQSLKLGTGFSFARDSLGKYIPISWGCNFADFDNDGDLDLFVSCGSLNPSVEPNPDFYFENENGHFVNKAGEVGLLNRGIGRGSVVFDYDNDGDLDLLLIQQKPVNDGLNTESVTHLFRNDLIKKENWLKVALAGVDADTKGIGAHVKVVAGNLRMMREIDGGSSHESQNSTIAHFGLGSATHIDSVIVTWVGGKEQSLKNPAINSLITIREINNRKGIPLIFLWMVILVLLISGLVYFLIRFAKKMKQIHSR